MSTTETFSSGDSVAIEVSRKEKIKGAFSGGYEVASSVRDFDRAWGSYDGAKPFSLVIGEFGDRLRNLSADAIKSGGQLDRRVLDQMVDDIASAKERLTEFETSKESGIFKEVANFLDALKESLRGGDSLAIFEAAVRLDSFYFGLTRSQDFLLVRAEQEAGV